MNFHRFVRAVLAGGLLLTVCGIGSAQTKKPAPAPSPIASRSIVVRQIDAAALTSLLKPKQKPLLVNFWATWCDPCREEFPDLVKIDGEYKGKIDFITVTLDDAADIKGAVPKFLADMKAEMPAYLLVTPDESAVITTIAKDWSGGLPFTVLYNDKGELSYFRQGKVKTDALRTELDKLLLPPTGGN